MPYMTAHNPRVQLSVLIVSTCWCSELGQDTPSKYLAAASTPKHYNHNYSYYYT